MSIHGRYVHKEAWEKKFWQQQMEHWGLIWRTLAQYDGLPIHQIVTVTKLTRNVVSYSLSKMGGVRRDEYGYWHATDVSKDWLEVLL